MVGIHRNLKIDIAHNEVLLFLGIGSNKYNKLIIFNNFASMCLEFKNDVSYLLCHYKNYDYLLNFIRYARILRYRKLRRTNAGVLLYSEFGYNFKCYELDGIYD